MKYLMLSILLSVFILGCKPGKKVNTKEQVSSIAAQSDVIFGGYRLNEKQSIQHNSITSGLLFYPIDTKQETYLRIKNDSSIVAKNAVINLLKEDKTELIKTFKESQKIESETKEHNTETNINRNIKETTKSQANDFRGILRSILLLIVIGVLLGYLITNKIP